MKTIPTPPLNLPDSAPALALRLGLVLAAVVALVARRFLRMPRLMGLTILLCTRLGRAARRFERAMTHPARARKVQTRASRAGTDRGRAVVLPRGRGWLVRALGYEAAGLGCQLEALMADPAMQAVVAGSPAAGRILRPICRMLGVVAPAVDVAVPSIEPVVAVEPRACRPRSWPLTAAAGCPGVEVDCCAPAGAH